MPLRDEIRVPAARLEIRPATAESGWSWIWAELNNRNLVAIFYLSTIGLLIALCVMRAFPEWGEVIAAAAQFP